MATMNRAYLRRFAIALTVLALTASPGSAQRGGDKPAGETRAAQSGVLSLLPADSVTQHAADARGETLKYTAKAGTLALFDQSGEKSGAIFYTAYTLNGAAAASRPVTFVFNGGPGASSAYLHLGLAGPRVVDFGTPPNGANAKLVGNPDTWLKFTDLVMIDPIGTGWSRAAKADGASGFWGVRQDAQVLAKAVALYVADNGRAASPKFLLGESYGGFRAVKVARALQQEQGIVISGIVMVSPFLDGPLHGANRYALGAALQLPSLAAAELDRRGRFSDEALRAAERFAMTDYLVTLAGPPPRGEAAQKFYARVAAISGLPLDVVTRTRGFIRDAYVKHARGEQQEIVSPYDAAAGAPDPYPESSTADGDDPVLDGYLQALGGAFVAYARDELGFKTDMTFHLLNREVSGRWDWGGGGRAQASVTRDLRVLLALNPSLRVLIAHGRSDIVTPYGVSRYVLDHLPPIGGEGRTGLKIYQGGHMFYFIPAARAAFADEARAFYQRTVE